MGLSRPTAVDVTGGGIRTIVPPFPLLHGENVTCAHKVIYVFPLYCIIQTSRKLCGSRTKHTHSGVSHHPVVAFPLSVLAPSYEIAFGSLLRCLLAKPKVQELYPGSEQWRSIVEGLANQCAICVTRHIRTDKSFHFMLCRISSKKRRRYLLSDRADAFCFYECPTATINWECVTETCIVHAVWFIRDGFIRDAFRRLLELLEILRDEV